MSLRAAAQLSHSNDDSISGMSGHTADASVGILPRVGVQVMLNKSTWAKQRRALSRPVEQVIQQRAASVRQFAASDEQWLSWSGPTSRSLSVTATVLDKLSQTELRPEGRFWFLDLSLSADDYVDLSPGPEVSLRFVHT